MRKKTLLLTLLLAPFFCLAQWAQLGSDLITNINASNPSSISMDSVGNTVAIGFPGGSVITNNTPPYTYDTLPSAVKIYELINADWVQKGSTLSALNNLDNFGSIVKINGSGDVLAIAAPRYSSNNPSYINVYSLNGSDWVLRGDTIFTDYTNIDLSSDGNSIVVGDPINSDYGTNSGKVKVYRWNGNSYTQLGNDIYNSQANAYSGRIVAMAGSGNRIVFENQGVDAATQKLYSLLHVIEYTNNGWLEIDSIRYSNFLSQGTVKMDASGNTIVVGGEVFRPANEPNSTFRGRVSIWHYKNNKYVSKGGDFIPEPFNLIGFDGNVDLSQDGNTVIIGNINPSCRVTVFKYNNNNWVNTADFNLPYEVILTQFNANGDKFAFINNTDKVGVVYENTQVSSVSTLNTSNHLSIYPNPTNSVVNISTDANVTDYELYSIDGRLIKSENGLWDSNLTIDLATQNSGIYLLKVKTNDSTETVRINKN